MGAHIEVIEVYGDNLEVRFAVLVNGFQVGGNVDKSGAGNLTFMTREEANAYARKAGAR